MQRAYSAGARRHAIVPQPHLSRRPRTSHPSELPADRTAIRDAIASVDGYEGLASGPISFCAAPTPQCRDGNRTAVLIGYTKGGENFETEVLARVTMEPDFGLE